MTRHNARVDGYMSVGVEQLKGLCSKKLARLDEEEAAEHDRQIEEIRTSQTAWHWWHGTRPAPDTTREEAEKQYAAKVTYAEYSFPSPREEIERLYAHHRVRCSKIRALADHSILSQPVLLSSEALYFLTN